MLARPNVVLILVDDMGFSDSLWRPFAWPTPSRIDVEGWDEPAGRLPSQIGIGEQGGISGGYSDCHMSSNYG
jgi:hypothetical protein